MKIPRADSFHCMLHRQINGARRISFCVFNERLLFAYNELQKSVSIRLVAGRGEHGLSSLGLSLWASSPWGASKNYVVT